MKSASDSRGNAGHVNENRRRFLGFRGRESRDAVRPPWTNNASIIEACTRCDACVKACPENVLVRGDGGFPEFSPKSTDAECIFCGDCAVFCPEDLFDLTVDPAIPAKARILDSICLAAMGIHCECCRDSCEVNALRFRPRLGGPPIPSLDADCCTACGACLGVCPKDAIALVPDSSVLEAA